MLKKDASSPDGVRAPRAGEIMKNPTLAQTFRTFAAEGKKGFYTGRIAEEFVKVVQGLGGHLALEDLQHHLDLGSETVDPISLKFTAQGLGRTCSGSLERDADGGPKNGKSGDEKETPQRGLEVWEHPPNGQGIIALLALGILQALEESGKIPTFTPEDFNTAPYLHAIIESLRLAFSDGSWYVADPKAVHVPVKDLLSAEYIAKRAELFDPERALSGPILHGDPTTAFVSPALQSSDTVYFSVVDGQGNGCSFINSNYGGFGTGIIPKGCGFTLQNRGAGFSLDSGHPNVLAPNKRPYHTIIPGLVTNLSDSSLHSVFGVMGGFMQPQGHVQVLLGQVVGRLDPQRALDAPRICIGAGVPEEAEGGNNILDWNVKVEEGMSDETIEGLRKLGHDVQVVEGMKRSMFGKGQIIRETVDVVEGRKVWSAGSDMRGDGAAYAL